MDNRSRQVITARRDGIVTKRVSDEVVIYDLDTDKVHLLNAVASCIWERASGDPVDLVAVMEAVEERLGPDHHETVVYATVQQLVDAGLLEEHRNGTVIAGMDRRRLLKMMGAAAVMAPAITTILAPPAAAHISPGHCHTSGQSCASTLECCQTPSAQICRSSGLCGACTALYGSGCGANSDCCTVTTCTTINATGYCCSGHGTVCALGSECCSNTCTSLACACHPSTVSGAASKPNVVTGAGVEHSVPTTLCCDGRRRTDGTCCVPAGGTPTASNAGLCCSGSLIPPTVSQTLTAQLNTAGTSLVLTLSATIPVGSLLVAGWTTPSAHATQLRPTGSITDSKANTWTSQGYLHQSGTVGGIITAPVTTQLVSGDSITLTLSHSVTPKAMIVYVLTDATLNGTATTANGAGAAGTAPTVTQSVTSANRVLGFIAAADGTAATADTDTVNGSWSAQTKVEVTGAALSLASQHKLVTATANQTFDGTITSSTWFAGSIAVQTSSTLCS